MPDNPFSPRSQSSSSCSVTPALVPCLFGHRRVGAHRIPQHPTSLAHFFACPRRVDSFADSFFSSRCPRKQNLRFVHHNLHTITHIAAYMLCFAQPIPSLTPFHALSLTLVNSARLLRSLKLKRRKAPSQRPRGGQSELFLPICSLAKTGERESRLRTLMLGSVSGSPLPMISI